MTEPTGHDDDEDLLGGQDDAGGGSLVSRQLSQLLEDSGVVRHKQTRLVAELLETSHPAARRKLNGSTELNEEELRKILKHLGYTWKGLEGIEKSKDDPRQQRLGRTVVEAAVMIEGAVRKCLATVIYPLRRTPVGARSLGIIYSDDKPEKVVDTGSLKHGESAFAIEKIEVNVAYERTGVEVAVLDDDEGVVTMMCRNLDKYGFRASGFTTIDQLLEEMKHGHVFEAFILDWTLQSGWTIEPHLGKLRETAKESKIIIMSGRIDDEDVQQAIDEAAMVYGAVILPKPCPIIAITQQLLRTQQAR